MLLLTAGLLAMVGLPGCSRTPEDEMRRAVARLDFIMTTGSGGSIEYEEGDPARAPIGVNLERADIVDACLRYVGKLTTLRTLNLRGVYRLTDHALAYLVGLTSLQTLDLHGTRISDAGLRHLSAMAQLREMDLSDNPRITDAGLKHLHELRELLKVELKGTAVSEAGIEELQRRLPEVQIER